MKKTNKRFLPTIAVLASAFLLTGCDFFSSASTAPKPSDTPSQTTASTAPKSDSPSASTSKPEESKPKPSESKPSDVKPSESKPSTPSTPVIKKGTVSLSFDSEKGNVIPSVTEGNVGTEVTLTITCAEGFEIDAVKANGTTLTGPDYSFALIEGENSVEVTFKAIVPEVREYSITAATDENYEIKELSKAKAEKDAIITFKVEVKNEAKEIESVKANETECTLQDDVYSFTMPEADVTLTVILKDKEIQEEYALSLEKEGDLKEGDGAKMITVNITPDAVATDWVFDVSGLNGIGVVTPLPDDHPSKKDNVRFFTPVNAGKGTLKVSCKVGETLLEKSFEIQVEADYTKYKEIKTASDFISLIEKTGTITDKYYLSSNIDLGGRIVNGREKDNHFNGVLDGRGHTVKNFEVKNSSDKEPDKASGLFWMVGGTVRNLHLSGTISDHGFSGLLAKEISGDQALVEDCLFEAKNTYLTTDWTWGRNGVIASTLQTNATIRNVVTNLDENETGATCLPFFAYSWNKATMQNCYTNIAHDEQYENYIPFSPDGTYSFADFVHENIKHTPFDSTKKDAFATLNEDIWTLEDDKMPVLKHESDAFVMLEPEVKASISKTSLFLKDGEKEATITVSLENTDKEAVYEAVVSDTEIISVTKQEDGSFKVTALKEGTATIQIKATIEGKEYLADLITVTVKGLDAPEYEIPEGAFEIKDVATFKQVFTGGGEFCGRDFYLSSDIDMTGETLPNNGVAGDFVKTFEGQGHTIKASYNWGMFNIVSGTIRNVTLITDSPSEANHGAICHTLNGTMENVHVKMSVVEGRAESVFAGVCYINNGAIKNSTVDFTINTPCNTIHSFAVANGSGTYENCTYTVDGSWDGKDNAVIANDGTTLQK